MELFKKYAAVNLESHSVREIKFARARYGVLKAFVDELRTVSYEDIRIKDLCRRAEISEPSFYNYFPKKEHLFLYYIGLWGVDVQLHMKDLRPGLTRIYELFQYTGDYASKNANLLMEIIAYQARTNTIKSAKEIAPLTAAEKRIVFGNEPNIDSFSDQGLGPILKENIREAILSGELPKTTSVDTLLMTLASVFFGLPVLILHEPSTSLSGYYKKVLQSILPLPSRRKK
ncbi:TetR/AcrR family transcriptional regulator [Leptospira ognonensis]|uniref:TetR/AcrR family transcriptional regulator n=1 Tax=Leptospira ognonensis TaxID=2484945 RepID=A0A4R9JXS2_9LEPT|nr:TetR/AcrR family transcriptional regulator [Leptospira ognonensis]TGL56398.1 TetR/AcrR family transcriptional regulator [Leptospira ognonensis]